MLAVFDKSLIHSYLKKICPDPFHYDYSYQLQFIIDPSTTHRSIPAQMSLDAMLPPDEPERLAALQRYEILDTPPDGAFNHLDGSGRSFVGCRLPWSALSITTGIWFKSHHGLEVCETGREPGLCASAIFSPAVYHIRDALTDARALANPLVTKEVGLRFYAAAPLRTPDGFNLGTLCIMDRRARKLSVLEAGMLTKLAALVMDQMELRLAVRKVAELEQVERSMREEHEGLGKSEEHLRDLFDLLEQEKARLEAQNIYLQEEIRSEHNFGDIIGGSSAMRKVTQQIQLVAPTSPRCSSQEKAARARNSSPGPSTTTARERAVPSSR